MIHYLFAGHFVRDEKFIKFARLTPNDPDLYSPVVRKRLAQSVIDELLRKRGLSEFPDEWGMSLAEEGFIVWDIFCGIADASEFIAQLAERTHCDLAAYSSQTILTADGVRELARDDR